MGDEVTGADEADLEKLPAEIERLTRLLRERGLIH